jgi:hypothetical protein
MRAARVFPLALGAAAALSSARADASPEDLFGYGGRTSAMGATGVAHAAGYESAWHNPALASTIRENKLSLGYGGAVFALDGVGTGAGGRVSTPAAKQLFVGADVPIPFGGKLRDRIGIALAFSTPSDVIVRGRVLYPERPQFPLLGDRSQSLTIRAGLGVDLGWGVKVGIGFAALAELVGSVVAATDASGRVGTRVEDQLVATYAPTFGVTFEPPGDSKVRVGVLYRGTLDARFSIIVDGTKLSTIPIPPFNISGVAQYDPAQLAVEVARVEPFPSGAHERRSSERTSNVLAAQLVFKRWSDFPGVLEPSVVCSEGGVGACGLAPPPVAWRDTVAVRIGAEQGFEIARGVVLRARGGGFVETSALPPEVPGSDAFDVRSKGVVQVPTRYFDSTRVAVTSGLGVSIERPLPPVDLDLYAQYHVLMPRTITSTDAAGAPLSKAEASGHVTVFGLIGGVKF